MVHVKSSSRPEDKSLSNKDQMSAQCTRNTVRLVYAKFHFVSMRR
jgi:hypothetical protein